MKVLAVTVAALALLSACGDDPPPDVPDVVGERLDVAIAVLEDVGLEGEAIGGGIFGIVEEDNWYVCEQRPAAGQPPDLPRPVKLVVERECPETTSAGDGEDAEPSSPQSESTVMGSEEPSETPTRDESISDDSDAGGVLTVANSSELATVLRAGQCDASIGKFADKYGGNKVKFDGSIVVMAKPRRDVDRLDTRDHDTRYDMLLGAGDKGPKTVVGPIFKFEDVNVLELNFTGANKPDYLGVGDLVQLVAKVGEFNPDTCIFFLEPVSTKVR